MRFIDDHRNDLWTEFLDRDIERLLGGVEPYNEDLSPLTPIVSALADLGKTPPSQEVVAHHAALAALTVRESRLQPAPVVHPTRASGIIFGLRRRAVATLASLMMLTSLTGVAWASNTAAPGDWNYGIDLALERVGIGAGGAVERLEEASTLVDQAEPPDGQAAPEVLNLQSNLSASQALEEAAERISTIEEGSEQAQLVREDVAELLEFLSQNPGGADPGKVAELAKDIGRSGGGQRPATLPENQGRPTGNGQGSPKRP